MLAHHQMALPPSPSVSHWPREDLKENNALPSTSSSSYRSPLGSSSTYRPAPRRKTPSILAATPYDRPAHPSSHAGPSRRRIQSMTNIVGGRSRGLRIPSLQEVACKIENQTTLVEGVETSPRPDGPVVFDRGSAFLPLSLPRPDRMAVIDVGAVEELEGVPYPFVMDKLMEQGPGLLQSALSARLSTQSTASSKAQSLSPPLPQVLDFDLIPPSFSSPASSMSIPPNYVLAIRPPPSANGAQQQGSLLPIHDIVYRATCAHLPPIPARLSTLLPSSLPVISITLPSPSTLPLLNTFLYTQRPDILLSSLLNLPPLPAAATPRTRAELTTYLAQTMDLRALLERIGVVHQVWGNTCSLGVADSLLWKALDAAWEVLVGSVAIVQARGPAPAPAPTAYDSASSTPTPLLP